MKKINILFAFSIPFLIINCSGKVKASKIPQIGSPSPVQTQVSRPNLGRVISLPTIRQSEVATRTLPREEPFGSEIIEGEQTFKHGESHFLKKFKLSNKIKESSGLLKVDNKLWTFNDSGGKAVLYQIDEQSGRIVNTLSVKNASNNDWEDIASDDNYVYIGDFGNNRGNRRDLKVYKIPRASLRTQKSVRAEIIYFTYSDQKDFKSKPQKNNYDCEAMIAYRGKLYLFSKNWQNHKTRLYELSTISGKHKAKYMGTFNIEGMVTGASINKELGILLLTTYSSLLNVNIWAFTNFHGNNFFRGDSKQLNLVTPLQGQIEGVTFTNNYKAYLSSEAFKKYIFSLDATLYKLDFSGEFE